MKNPELSKGYAWQSHAAQSDLWFEKLQFLEIISIKQRWEKFLDWFYTRTKWKHIPLALHVATLYVY